MLPVLIIDTAQCKHPVSSDTEDLYHLKCFKELLWCAYKLDWMICINNPSQYKESCWCVCVGMDVCVWQCTDYPESSVGKGTVHSSCVQVSWLDLFICIYLHAVKRSCRWHLPEPTVFLDPGPILSAWLHGMAKRSGITARLISLDETVSFQRTEMTSKCHWVRVAPLLSASLQWRWDANYPKIPFFVPAPV